MDKILKVMEKKKYDKFNLNQIPEIRRKVWKKLKKKNLFTELEFTKQFNGSIVEVKSRVYSLEGLKIDGKKVKRKEKKETKKNTKKEPKAKSQKSSEKTKEKKNIKSSKNSKKQKKYKSESEGDIKSSKSKFNFEIDKEDAESDSDLESDKNNSDKELNVEKIVIPKKFKKIMKQIKRLKKMPQPDQRTPEWFKMREEMITASELAAALGKDHYKDTYKYILGKLGLDGKFPDNPNTYHGKKYERIAIMFYEILKNTIVEEYGLLKHPDLPIGASPDGINGHRKFRNRKKFNKKAGRLIEVKCVASRKIEKKGEIKGKRCPEHYWIQVQSQLQCTDFQECDFWQNKITEYKDKVSFEQDSNSNEVYYNKEKKWKYNQSKATTLPKGCVIELMPKGSGKTSKDIWKSAKHIYPERLDMTNKEYSEWIKKTKKYIELKKFKKIVPRERVKEFKDYEFSRVCYWRFDDADCCRIERDQKWFENVTPKIKKVWSLIKFFRDNTKMQKLWFRYIQSLSGKDKNNDEIMKTGYKLMDDESYYDELKPKVKKVDSKIRSRSRSNSGDSYMMNLMKESKAQRLTMNSDSIEGEDYEIIATDED